MIKVGLIGGGGIANAHIRGYRAHAEQIGVTAVADAVDQTVPGAGRRAGRDARYTDYRQMLAEPKSTRSTSACHTTCTQEAIVAAAEAGKHILCEKPLCLTARPRPRTSARRSRKPASP